MLARHVRRVRVVVWHADARCNICTLERAPKRECTARICICIESHAPISRMRPCCMCACVYVCTDEAQGERGPSLKTRWSLSTLACAQICCSTRVPPWSCLITALISSCQPVPLLSAGWCARARAHAHTHACMRLGDSIPRRTRTQAQNEADSGAGAVPQCTRRCGWQRRCARRWSCPHRKPLCTLGPGTQSNEQRATSYEQRATSYKLQATSYLLRLEAAVQGGDNFDHRQDDLVSKFHAPMEHA